MSIVKSLSVSGYKSIKELTNFELRNLNVLIGANGAGKSNFISLFRLLNEIDTQDDLLHFGTGALYADFCLENQMGEYHYRLSLIPPDNRIIVDSNVSGMTIWHNHFYDTIETVKNSAPYLRMLHEKYPSEYQRIVETISLVLPFFHDFMHRQEEQDFIELEWIQKGKLESPYKSHRLSNGSLRFICLTILLLQPMSLLPNIILLDNPEMGLHPYAISIFADMCKQVAEQRQLIISTQAVELVNELSPEDIIVVDKDNDASTFRRYTKEELAGWLEEYAMGELWKRNILGGRPY